MSPTTEVMLWSALRAGVNQEKESAPLSKNREVGLTLGGTSLISVPFAFWTLRAKFVLVGSLPRQGVSAFRKEYSIAFCNRVGRRIQVWSPLKMNDPVSFLFYPGSSRGNTVLI